MLGFDYGDYDGCDLNEKGVNSRFCIDVLHVNLIITVPSGRGDYGIV
jgi:hypothetical protein